MLSCIKLKIVPQFQMCTDARQQPVSCYIMNLRCSSVHVHVLLVDHLHMLLLISGYRRCEIISYRTSLINQ